MTSKMKSMGALALMMAMSGLSSLSDGASPVYHDLPEIELNKPPQKKDLPKEISGLSKVNGLFSALPKPHKRNYGAPGMRYVGMFVNRDDAKKYSEDKLDRWGRRPDDSIAGTSTVCFNVMDHWELSSNVEEWPTRIEQWPQLRSAVRGSDAAKQAPDYQKPRAFRIERLALEEGKATMHLQEGWFDPVTLGAKQTANYRVTYDEVATGPSDVKVYAARNADTGSVEIVVYQPLLDKRLMGIVGSHMAIRHANNHGSSDCGHARIALRTAPGVGDQGAIQLDVILPDEKTGKAPELPPEGKPNDDDPTEVRVRSLVVHGGVSQGLQDDEPVVSITFGWRGKERRQQVF